MKWLVQQLDILVSHRADNDGLSEQKRLEGLITRLDAIIVIAIRDVPNWMGGGNRNSCPLQIFATQIFEGKTKDWGKRGEKQKIPSQHFCKYEKG